MAPARRYDEDDYDRDDDYRRNDEDRDRDDYDRDRRDGYRDDRDRDDRREYERPIIRRRDEYEDEEDDYGGRSRGYRCPFCRTRDRPHVSTQVSSAGWTVFVIMILFCWPLFFIGLLMTEEVRVCSECGMKLG